MTRLFLLLLGAVRALVRRRSDLVLENLALRQQVAALAAKGGRPRVTAVDRWLCCAGTAPGSVAIGLGCRGTGGVVDRGPARVSAH